MRCSWRSVSWSWCLFVFGLGFVMPQATQAAPPTPPKPRHKQGVLVEKDQSETMILPLRYVDGYRLARMMRMFVPREHRDSEIRYSPSLHKILIRARPAVLQLLKRASEQMDVPQAQFGVRIFFVKTLEQGEIAEKALSQPLAKYLRRIFPAASGFSLVESLYIHAINHQQAQLKIANLARISDPSVQITLHQAPQPKSGILVEFLIKQHESFRAVGPNGPNTQFISSVHLSTKLFVQPGAIALIGHTPLRRARKLQEQVLALVQIVRLRDDASFVADANSMLVGIAKPTSKMKSPPKTSIPSRPWGRHSISRVIRENRKHFKVCYERALAQQPKLKGRVVISFAIQAKGDLKDVHVKYSTLQQPQVEACILRHFKIFRFPSPPNGRVVRVNYPLLFNYK